LRIEKTQLVSEVEDLISSDAPDDVVLSGIIEAVHEAHPTWDWSGIYLLVDEVLVIGPFAGSEEPPDHARIEVGDGVCGTAVAENSNQLVADVRQLDNYLACSLHTRSELVVLIHHKDEIVGQFDIDSDTVGAFTKEDENLLEEISTLIAPRVASLACHMER
jgi:putative methionine-R-sulfoxide reductase with GAF domain